MDNAAFATWRAENRVVDGGPTGVGILRFGLAEADDPIEHPDDEIGETAPPDEIARAPAVTAPTAVGLLVEEKPEPELLSKVGRDRIAGFGSSSLRRFRNRRLGPRERHASVSLQGLPEDVHSVDGDALVRIALQGPLDRSDASLDQRRVHREGGGALRDRSHDGVPMASPLSFRSQPRQAEVSIGHSRGGRDIHSGIFQGPA